MYGTRLSRLELSDDHPARRSRISPMTELELFVVLAFVYPVAIMWAMFGVSRWMISI